MNPEQTKSVVRWVITVFGSVLAGWMARSGVVTTDQIMSALNSESFISFVVSIVGLLWGLKAHTQVSTVTAANSFSAVAGVITMPTAEGRALSEAIPEKSVAVAGSSEAADVAKR